MRQLPEVNEKLCRGGRDHTYQVFYNVWFETKRKFYRNIKTTANDKREAWDKVRKYLDNFYLTHNTDHDVKYEFVRAKKLSLADKRQK